MKRLRSLNLRGRGIAAWAAMAAIIAAVFVIAGADVGTAANSKAVTGEDLYKTNCGRCHAERYPRERTDAQWKTIMLQMRVRGQLSGDDARKILKYLQENN